MLIIQHRLKTSADFMDRYLSEGTGGFFLPEKLGMPKGRKICLELHLEWLGERYFPVVTVERTGVSWDNGGRKMRGAIVRFVRGETALRDTILEQVERSAGGYRSRASDRIRTALKVHSQTADRHHTDGRVRDISPTGAFIRTPNPLPNGTEVHLRLEDRGRQVLHHVRARVVRLDFSPMGTGMAVEFRFDSRRERRAMARLCVLLGKDPQPQPFRHTGGYPALT